MSARAKVTLGIFLVALVARFFAVAKVADDLEPIQISVKEFDIARNALDGRFLETDWDAIVAYTKAARSAGRLVDYDPPRFEPKPEWYQDGGLGLVLAGLWKITGSRSPSAVSWLQAVLDALLVLLVVRAGTKLYSFRAGALAGAAYALFLPLIAEVARPTYYVWPVFAGVIGLWLLAEFSPDQKPQGKTIFWLVLVGLAIGALHWVRSVVVLFSTALAIGVALRTRSVKRGAAALVCLVLLHGLVVFPLSYRHHNVTGSWSPTQGNWWHMWWIGIGQYENSWGCENEDAAAMAWAKANFQDGDGFEFEERHVKARVLEIMQKDPGLLARNFARRLGRLTPFAPETGLRWWPKTFDRPFVLLWPLALAFAFKRRALLPAALPAAYFVFTVVPYYYLSVYVLPGIVVLLVPISGLLAEYEDPVFLPRERRNLSLAAWLLALLLPPLSCTIETSHFFLGWLEGEAYAPVLEGALGLALGVALGLLSRNRKQAAALFLAAVFVWPSFWHVFMLGPSLLVFRRERSGKPAPADEGARGLGGQDGGGAPAL